MFDKVVICEKFISRGLPLVKLDEKFLFYTQIIDDLKKSKPYFDISSIRINLQPLIDGICEHAIEWKNTLGRIVADRTTQNIMNLRNHIKVIKLY